MTGAGVPTLSKVRESCSCQVLSDMCSAASHWRIASGCGGLVLREPLRVARLHEATVNGCETNRDVLLLTSGSEAEAVVRDPVDDVAPDGEVASVTVLIPATDGRKGPPAARLTENI